MTHNYESPHLQRNKARISDVIHDPKENELKFLLTVIAPDTSVLSVPLSSISCSLVPVGKESPIHTTVTVLSTCPQVYAVQCNPSTRGTHLVAVQVYGVQFESASLVIPFNPYFDTITPVRIITGLTYPWGVAKCDNGRLMVTESWGHRVTVLNSEGRKIESLRAPLGSELFSNPRGIAATAQNFIYIADDDRIQKINTNKSQYTCTASVGEKGSGPLQFNCPVGVAVSPLNGYVYVADCRNHRIQVFTPDLTFSHSFGSQGSAIGYFFFPFDVAIDGEGFLYVTENGNCRIQKFTADEKFVTQFCSETVKSVPAGITVDANGFLYVTDIRRHSISILSSEGQFIRSYGRRGDNESQFMHPRGLTVDDNGFLYICDYGNNRLVVYEMVR